MSWRVARSLDVLLAQLNALAPGRSKRSDGSIGDANHQNRSSDHNPWYGPGIVTARDFTHDPAHLNCQSVADRLTAHGDPRIKYIIWNRRIWSPGSGWRPYTGPNPHTSHLHLSVVASPLCDDSTKWRGFTAPVVTAPKPEPVPKSPWEDITVNPLAYHQVIKADGDPRIFWATTGGLLIWIENEDMWSRVVFRIRQAQQQIPANYPGQPTPIPAQGYADVDSLEGWGVVFGQVPDPEDVGPLTYTDLDDDGHPDAMDVTSEAASS